MEVILLQKVANLGNIGDRVKVRSGFGRNFLLPQGKATLVTPSNVAQFEARRAELENIARSELESAQQRAAALREFKLTITAKAGTEGKLFGSVGTSDIAEAATAAGHALARAEVRLPGGPLRNVGDHSVSLHLHADVDVTLAVTILAEEPG
jgi:large subunit ribosomal protein L9